MSYKELSQKQQRTIEVDINTLFSIRAFLQTPTIEDIKNLYPFHPNIKVNKGVMFLSEKGISAKKRLIQSISKMPSLCNLVSIHEIDSQTLKSYQSWIERNLQPTGHEFTNDVVSTLLSNVKQYTFLVQVEGIDIGDMETLNLGTFFIQRSNPAFFDSLEFEGQLDRNTIYSQFQNSFWLIGCVYGSQEVAREQFEYRVNVTVGILGICGAILYKGSIWRTSIRAMISPLGHHKVISSLRWEVNGANLSISRNWGAEQKLKITADSLAYLSNTCFLQQLANLPDTQDRSELQDAIIQSMYWFSDASKDRTLIMQFVKLWTCMECFFSIDDKKITELNAKGIASILTFAGFQIIDPKDYPEFKKKIKKMYDLRSRAVHRAEFGHIQTRDIDDLTNWVAWVVVSMVALTESGYKTLRQVQEQISRLDNLY